MNCLQVISIWHQQFYTFSESNLCHQWTAEFCLKQWLAQTKPPLENKGKQRPLKPGKNFQQEPGDNRSQLVVLVQLSILMKETARFRKDKEQRFLNRRTK